MAKYDFDRVIDRRGTDSLKWEGYETRFPGLDVKDALPMWVADMDFPTPIEIREEVQKIAAREIYGYGNPPGDDVYEAIIRWIRDRHGWEIKKEWIVFTQGVVPAITYAVQEFTDEGDGVLIQPPVYYPFKQRCITFNHRQAVESPLTETDEGYRIDFEDFEKKASDPRTKLFILCSPHNPVGRVWTKDELYRVGQICGKHGVLVFSDEIHADLIMEGYRHTASALAMDPSLLISAYAASKTFNIAGLKTSFVVIPDEKIRKRYQGRVRSDEAAGLNMFGAAALRAAFTYGEEYRQQVIQYVGENLAYIQNFVQTQLPGVRVSKTEGTYFAWLNFRGLGVDGDRINHLICEEAKVAGDLGNWFGKEGYGFIRLNTACPRSIVEEAMHRIQKAVSQLG